MADRSATTHWFGALTTGSGTVRLDSSQAGQFDFSLPSRASDVHGKTNPEELIAAAHSACYSMQLSALLTSAGTPPEHLATEAVVTQGMRDGAYVITRVRLVVRGVVPGVDATSFQSAAELAKNTCPVSIALNGTEIVLDAALEDPESST